MMTLNRHIRTCQSSIRHSLMMLWLLLTAMLAACSGSSDIDEPQGPQESAVLDIYVYAPGQAVPTRGNEGQVASDQEAERAVHTLQIWVFTHALYEDVHKKVTYFSTEVSASFYNSVSDTPHKFQLPLGENFSPESVDVFVLANVTNANSGHTFEEETPYATLKAALLDGKFGLSSPVTSVPEDGLPMSGVIFNQPIYGSSPAYRIGTASTMSTVKLVRMVSKVRFLFSCSTEFAALKINSVTLGEHQIPNQEYLFLEQPYTYEGNYYHIVGGENGYNTETPSLLSMDATARYVKPAFYTYERYKKDYPASTAQDYEDLINKGVSDGHISETKVYLRESDKLLSGTITYQVKEKDNEGFGDPKTTAFSMADPESNETRPYYFSRNHTWIVFGYLAWAEMDVVTVTINEWDPDDDDHTLYNW